MTEGRRDGETERRRDRGTLSCSVSLSLRPSVSLSLLLLLLLGLCGRRRAGARRARVCSRDGAQNAGAVRVFDHAPGQEVLDLGLVAGARLNRSAESLFA